MSLVEHPFASLQKEKDTRVIELHWEAQHPLTGKKLQASWRVVGDPELGLPTANDERLYLVLMEITRELGWPITIPFCRLDIVRRMGWTPSQKTYRMVHEGFARLKGVSITAQNAFYNSKNNWFYCSNSVVWKGRVS